MQRNEIKYASRIWLVARVNLKIAPDFTLYEIRGYMFFIYTSFPVTFQYLPGYGIPADQLLFFGCISIRVLALPSPGILTHLFDAVLRFPSQFFFCFGRIAVAHGDVTCTSRFDLVFYFMTACLFKCMNHIQYTVTMSCSQAESLSE